MQNSLIRGLSRFDAISLVIGTVIGTGVFLKTAVMGQLAGSPSMVLLAWLVAGVLSLMGALSYSELGATYPEAGGEYVYLKQGWGKALAFLYGWQRFWIGSPGSVAAYGVGAATFLGGLFPETIPYQKAIAVAMIASFALLNCLGVKQGGMIQTFLTALKMLMVIGLSVAIFAFAQDGSFSHLSETSDKVMTVSSFGAAVLAALWAFDGWNNLPMAAGEVREPAKNIPFALCIGTLAVFAIYALANVAYFYALPFVEVITSNSSNYPAAPSVAAKAALAAIGPIGATILSGAFVISALGAMHGSILTGSRIPYALAKDGLFLKSFAYLSPKSSTPIVAVLVEGVWASILALWGTFDQLTDMVVFASWIFYALCALAVPLLRKKDPQRARPYKVALSPWLPLMFASLSFLLLVNTVMTSWKTSLYGLIFILAGVPVYFILKFKSNHSIRADL